MFIFDMDDINAILTTMLKDIPNMNYYQYILKGDLVKGQEILDFLKENGLGEIVEKIRK